MKYLKFLLILITIYLINSETIEDKGYFIIFNY